jgi:hypothetical protein
MGLGFRAATTTTKEIWVTVTGRTMVLLRLLLRSFVRPDHALSTKMSLWTAEAGNSSCSRMELSFGESEPGPVGTRPGLNCFASRSCKWTRDIGLRMTTKSTSRSSQQCRPLGFWKATGCILAEDDEGNATALDTAARQARGEMAGTWRTIATFRGGSSTSISRPVDVGTRKAYDRCACHPQVGSGRKTMIFVDPADVHVGVGVYGR